MTLPKMDQNDGNEHTVGIVLVLSINESNFNVTEDAPALTQKGKPASSLDFRFKNPRLIAVDVPGLGRKKVWYCMYSVYNTSNEPITLVPDFVLAAGEKTIADEVIPKVQEVIRRIEDHLQAIDLKNSVSISLDPIPASKEGRNKKWVAGVAIFENPEKDVKDFKLLVMGLNRDWKANFTAGKKEIRRSALQIRFTRVENELRQLGPGEWVYHAYDVKEKSEAKK